MFRASDGWQTLILEDTFNALSRGFTHPSHFEENAPARFRWSGKLGKKRRSIFAPPQSCQVSTSFRSIPAIQGSRPFPPRRNAATRAWGESRSLRPSPRRSRNAEEGESGGLDFVLRCLPRHRIFCIARGNSVRATCCLKGDCMPR